MQLELVRQQLLRHELQASAGCRYIPNTALQRALSAIKYNPAALESLSSDLASLVVEVVVLIRHVATV